MIDHQIQSYRIERLIGEGGMGSVYFASHVNIDGRKAAIKSLHESLASDPHVRSRFRREAETLAQLQHPNVVTLYDYVENERGLFLIMEYINGVDLSKHIKHVTGPIPESQAVGIFSNVLDACAYAHNVGIIHRDVKPSNIMISQEGEIKVLDFGIAKLVTEDFSPILTKTGTKIGTVLYMSPEQVRGESVSHKSDIYSLGVTLFEMLAGRPPYDGEKLSEFEIQTKIVQEPLPDARELYPNISAQMQAVVEKATQKNPEDRFANCEEFLTQLMSIHNPMALSPYGSGSSSAIRISPRGHMPSPISSTVETAEGAAYGNSSSSPAINKVMDFVRKPTVWIPALLLLLGGIGFGAYRSIQQGKINDLLTIGFEDFKTGEYTSAIANYEEAEAMGSPEAVYFLGELYYNGAGVSKDVDKGFEYTNKSYEGGYCMAEWRLGMAYHDGEGVPEDKTKGNELIRNAMPCLEELAIEKGNAEAQANLGSMYYSGIGVAKDINEAIKWFKKAADQGYTIPMHTLMYIYYGGHTDDLGNEVLAKDYKKAFDYAFALRYQSFFPDVNSMLGRMHLNGEGTEEDRDSAMHYYELAAAPDTAYQAKVMVGFLYQNYEHDYEKAFQYYEPAAEKGIAMAQYGMGDLYYIGKPMDADKEKAYDWYQQAADNGFAPADYWMGIMLKNGEGTRPNSVLARESFQNMISSMDEYSNYEKAVIDIEDLLPKLCVELGYMIFNGVGGSMDVEKGADLYKMAAEYNHSWGTYYYAGTYKDGSGNPQNLDKAFNLYKSAIELGVKEEDNNLIGRCYYRLGQLYLDVFGRDRDEAKLIKALCFFKDGASLGDQDCRNIIRSLRKEYNVDLDTFCD